jgi:hypothetical protein
MRTLCKLCAVAVATPLLVGQMCGVGAPQPYGRLDVTPTLTEACDGFASEQEIEEMIFMVEQMRLTGLPMETVISANHAACRTEPCERCSDAVVSQVYGQ